MYVKVITAGPESPISVILCYSETNSAITNFLILSPSKCGKAKTVIIQTDLSEVFNHIQIAAQKCLHLDQRCQ